MQEGIGLNNGVVANHRDRLICCSQLYIPITTMAHRDSAGELQGHLHAVGGHREH